MKTTKSKTTQVRQSTYALLVRSEEKERSIFEAVAYGVFILSSVAAIWQFAQQPVTLPLGAAPRTVSVAQASAVANS